MSTMQPTGRPMRPIETHTPCHTSTGRWRRDPPSPPSPSPSPPRRCRRQRRHPHKKDTAYSTATTRRPAAVPTWSTKWPRRRSTRPSATPVDRSPRRQSTGRPGTGRSVPTSKDRAPTASKASGSWPPRQDPRDTTPRPVGRATSRTPRVGRGQSGRPATSLPEGPNATTDTTKDAVPGRPGPNGGPNGSGGSGTEALGWPGRATDLPPRLPVRAGASPTSTIGVVVGASEGARFLDGRGDTWRSIVRRLPTTSRAMLRQLRRGRVNDEKDSWWSAVPTVHAGTATAVRAHRDVGRAAIPAARPPWPRNKHGNSHTHTVAVSLSRW